VNGERLEPQKYYELLHQDAIRFGNSTREYVLIADDAAGK
jgi:smad nuclear-interacting protein 1